MKRHLGEEEIAAYLEGSVSKEEKLEFEIHLANCEKCLSNVVEIFAIQNETHWIPANFIHNATKRLTPKRRHRYLFYLESAALFLLVIFFGYNLFFESTVSRLRINQERVSQEKITAIEKEIKLNFNGRPMDYSRVTKKSEQKLNRKERGPIIPRKRKNTGKGELNNSINKDLRDNLKPELDKNDKQMVQSEGTTRQALPSSYPSVIDGINAGISNISETKNVAVPPKGPQMKKQIFQASSQMTNESDEQKRFIIEGDGNEKSILNIHFLQELITKLPTIKKDIVLLIEVNSDGKVVNVQSETDIANNINNYLISEINKLNFESSTISRRKIKIILLKTKINK